MQAHNKGKVFFFCKECKRKRYFYKIPIPNYNFKWTCSRGHSFVEEGVTLSRITAIAQSVLTKDKLENLFNRDDLFYSILRKR